MRRAGTLREESEPDARFAQLPFSGPTSRPKRLVSDAFSTTTPIGTASQIRPISALSRPVGQRLR